MPMRHPPLIDAYCTAHLAAAAVKKALALASICEFGGAVLMGAGGEHRCSVSLD